MDYGKIIDLSEIDKIVEDLAKKSQEIERDKKLLRQQKEKLQKQKEKLENNQENNEEEQVLLNIPCSFKMDTFTKDKLDEMRIQISNNLGKIQSIAIIIRTMILFAYENKKQFFKRLQNDCEEDE